MIILLCYAVLNRLTESSRDCIDSMETISILFLFIQGSKDANKYEIVKKSLICFVQNHEMNKAVSGLTDTHVHI